jgi:uncharacterized membrane protein YbaN (DUF454 family)
MRDSPSSVAETAAGVPWRRWLFGALGLVFLGLGLVGVVLPLLPTTPFLLLALWAFARSSRRLHDWLYGHPRFGPGLRAWHEHGVVPRRAKVASITFMAGSMAYVVLVTATPPWAQAAMAATLAAVAVWMVRRPERPPTP